MGEVLKFLKKKLGSLIAKFPTFSSLYSPSLHRSNNPSHQPEAAPTGTKLGRMIFPIPTLSSPYSPPSLTRIIQITGDWPAIKIKHEEYIMLNFLEKYSRGHRSLADEVEEVEKYEECGS
jgi:hypothetical protein